MAVIAMSSSTIKILFFTIHSAFLLACFKSGTQPDSFKGKGQVIDKKRHECPEPDEFP